MGVYAARHDWLRDNRETAVRFLRALLIAYDVLQKGPDLWTCLSLLRCLGRGKRANEGEGVSNEGGRRWD